MFYVTGCLEEAGIVLVRTAFDEDVAETLIIFIDDINSFYNSLDQCDQNLWQRIFCIFCKGEQPFFCLFQISNSNHAVLSAFFQFEQHTLRFTQFLRHGLNIILKVTTDAFIHRTHISGLGNNICLQFFSLLFQESIFLCGTGLLQNFLDLDFKNFLEAFAVLVRHIGKLLYDKFIQQDTINRFEITGLFAVSWANIFEAWFSICPTVRFGNNIQTLSAARTMDQSCQQSIGLSMRAVVFLSNGIQ